MGIGMAHRPPCPPTSLNRIIDIVQALADLDEAEAMLPGHPFTLKARIAVRSALGNKVGATNDAMAISRSKPRKLRKGRRAASRAASRTAAEPASAAAPSSNNSALRFAFDEESTTSRAAPLARFAEEYDDQFWGSADYTDGTHYSETTNTVTLPAPPQASSTGVPPIISNLRKVDQFGMQAAQPDSMSHGSRSLDGMASSQYHDTDDNHRQGLHKSAGSGGNSSMGAQPHISASASPPTTSRERFATPREPVYGNWPAGGSSDESLQDGSNPHAPYSNSQHFRGSSQQEWNDDSWTSPQHADGNLNHTQRSQLGQGVGGLEGTLDDQEGASGAGLQDMAASSAQPDAICDQGAKRLGALLMSGSTMELQLKRPPRPRRQTVGP